MPYKDVHTCLTVNKRCIFKIVAHCVANTLTALVLLSDTLGKEIIVHIPQMDSEDPAVLYDKLVVLFGPVVVKQTTTTVHDGCAEVETFLFHLGNKQYKRITTAGIAIASDGNLQTSIDQKLLAGYLCNSQGNFIFSPTLAKWTQDPFTQNRHGGVPSLAQVSNNLAKMFINTLSYEMRSRKAYEKALLKASELGDEQQARKFAKYCQKIKMPGNVYSEIDKGSLPEKLSEFKIGPNGFVLEVTKRDVTAKDKVVERITNEILPAFSFDLPVADLPETKFTDSELRNIHESALTGKTVNVADWENPVIGLEFGDDRESVIVGRVYEKSPAALAGIRNGDRLLSVDDNSAFLNSEHARKLIESSESPHLILSRSGEHLNVILKKVPLRTLLDSGGKLQIEYPQDFKDYLEHMWNNP